MKQFALGFALCLTTVSCLSWAAVSQLDVDSVVGDIAVHIDGKPLRVGSGKAATEERKTEIFDRIVLRSAEDLEVRIGPQLQVRVSGDDNLLDLIQTRVEGGRLVIDSHGSYRTRAPLRVQVQLPALNEFVLEGSADAQLLGLTGARLKLELDGSGSIQASGKVDDLDIEVNGSGDALLTALAAQQVEADLNGSGDIEVQAQSALRAEINGSGDIRYRGKPAQLKTAVNGSGDIEPME